MNVPHLSIRLKRQLGPIVFTRLKGGCRHIVGDFALLGLPEHGNGCGDDGTP